MNSQQLKKRVFKINGMHCASCEVLIERKFKKVHGVENVKVNHASGKAELYCSQEPRMADLQGAIKADGYGVSPWQDHGTISQRPREITINKDHLHTGAIFLIVLGAYLILKKFDLVPKLGISENMSYGFVFVIGLVAAMSTCLAVTGGLLLVVAAKYNERFPNLTGLQKFKPTLYFNIGRVVSYTVLGGAVGALGSVLTLSPRANGVLSIAASMVMIILGFQLLHLFPWTKRFQPKMPKFLAHKIHDMSGKDNKSAPALLGAFTFFLPCGFTQALQLYVLSQGNMMTGALTMLAFSLGTLPALFSLSAISSFARGAFQKHFLKVAGVVVVMLGFFNIGNGLTLAGINTSFASAFKSNAQAAQDTASNVEIVNGVQIAKMSVIGLRYTPSRFTVLQGVPVEWHIDGTRADGCGQVIVVPALGITEYLPRQGEKIIKFTPNELGRITFSCSMGMTTSGAAFTVVSNTKGIAALSPSSTDQVNPMQNKPCDPASEKCVPPQKLSMELSRERGFYPNSFDIQQGVPVELTIDVKTPPSGCMSVMVLPDYDVALPLKVGENKLTFTPTKPGVMYATCSMGIKMVQFNVTDKVTQLKERPGFEIPIMGREHIAVGAVHPPYNSNPPTSGWHYPKPAPWGVYEQELPDEVVIHNLEHGGIWISYKDIDAETKSKLKAIAARNPGSVIVVPRSKNDTKIALASWGRLQNMEAFNEKAILDFITENKNRSPELLAQ